MCVFYTASSITNKIYKTSNMHQRNFLIYRKMALSTTTCRLIVLSVVSLYKSSNCRRLCTCFDCFISYLYFLEVEDMFRIANMLENL